MAHQVEVESRCHRCWRWVIVLAAFMQLFCSLGLLTNYSILFVSLQDEFHSSSAIAGLLGSLAVSLSSLVSPLTILLERRLSRRVVVLVGVAVYCAGQLLTSFVPSVGYAYLTFGVLVGVGVNFMTNPAMSLLLDWFTKETYSRAVAMVLLGSTSGMMAFSPLMTTLITQYGWRNALRILSGGILVVGMAFGSLMGDPPTPEDYVSVQEQPQNVSQDQNHEKEDMIQMQDIHDGCRKDSEDEDQEEEEEDDDHTNAKEEDDCSVSLHESQVNACRGMVNMMRNLEPWLFFIGNMAAFTSWMFFDLNFASFMDGLGFDSNQIASVIVCFAGGELGGKLLLAVIGDRLPFMHVYLLAGSCLMGATVLGVLTVAKTYLTVALIAAASGLMRSGFYGGKWIANAQLFHELYGTNNTMAMAMVPTGLGVLISAPLSGVLVDLTQDYVISLLVIAAIFICAATSVLIIPIRRKLKLGWHIRSPQGCKRNSPRSATRHDVTS